MNRTDLVNFLQEIDPGCPIETKRLKKWFKGLPKEKQDTVIDFIVMLDNK